MPEQPATSEETTAQRATSMRIARGVLRTMRPHQWVKNAFVLAPLVFSLNMGSPTLLMRAVAATVLFCLLSSAVYLLNDLADLDADRAHPVKRLRPIASGIVPLALARTLCATFASGSLAVMLLIDRWAALAAAIYFAVNIAYSLRLKHTAFVDVGIIATGFLLRILAGSLAIDVPISVWLILCTFLLALYLALGKRKHELAQARDAQQRAVLSRYNPTHVRLAMLVVGGMTLAAYTAYTLAPATQVFFGFDWPHLILTVPFTAFGIARFFSITGDRQELGSPTEKMLKDTLFIVNLGAWVLTVLAIVYLA